MRRWLLITLVLLVLIAIPLCYRAYSWYRDWNDEMGLFANCASDRLIMLAPTAEAAAKENGGRFPDSATIIARLRQEERAWYTTCTGANAPFVWNPRLQELTLTMPERVPIAWCPPGSHGRHVGVILLHDGHVDHAMTTQEGLNQVLHAQPASPTVPSTRDAVRSFCSHARP